MKLSKTLLINIGLTIIVVSLLIKNIFFNSVFGDSVSEKLPPLSLPKIEALSNQPPPKFIGKTAKPPVYIGSGILLDKDSSYPLWEKNSRQPVSIASTAKIMTAIIVLENYNLQDVMAVPKEATQVVGSDTQLKWDEKLTIRQLLEATLIASGNDAAYSLAMHGQSLCYEKSCF
ncbi:MAG: D-alanyl-D-alanine carboxypeptidase [Candidatus Berkelbacteria bacterium Licking1014_2]|uniref:D-alanyl-D-alanine carboxypeptidase n=1 Tax=Candidatus Berkelbacteria bacterium Licking1014_2 TaxID=2017146 RepID=A0A554LWK6_9BACT|nr:MAG: D-alanyl-D-alanine carboxypeptidase [Candidatus Berkelbacteria bacterium Licking1014_2]